MPATAPDSTQPPLSTSLARICPRCREPAPEASRWDARCPTHGLAFVEARALVDGSQDPLLGATLAGRFTILSRIGGGSMGSVYRARQAPVGRDVALKIVRRDRAYDAETKLRFEREARAVSLLKSPHTVTAFDFGEAEDGSWFLALEMLEGETLGERLRREKRLHWVEALRFSCEALHSLAEAHSQGIIHRDLKPDNLFLARVHDPGGDREVCKILDFGIAKWVREEESPVDQLETLAGTVFGTPRYMSPEQAQGAPLDARSDLYSLGVLLFQMLSGRAPFVDDDAVVVMAKHIKEAPPELDEAAPGVDVPAPVEAVVRRALAKQPDHRPATAEQMLSELEQALAASRAVESGVRPHVAGNDELPHSLRLARRQTWLLGSLLVASLAVVVSLGGLVWKRSHVPGASRELLPERVGPLENSASNAFLRRASEVPLGVSSGAPSPSASSLHQPLPVASAEPPLRPVPGATAARKPAFRSKVVSPLERRGNERYGRFE